MIVKVNEELKKNLKEKKTDHSQDIVKSFSNFVNFDERIQKKLKNQKLKLTEILHKRKIHIKHL